MNDKRSFLDYLLLFFIIIVSGLATAFYRTVIPNILIFIPAFFFIIKNGAPQRLVYAYIIWFTYITLSFIKYPSSNLYWPFQYFVNITLAYGIIRYFSFNLIRKSEKIIYCLVVWSCILYAIQLFFGDVLLSVWRSCDWSGGMIDKSTTYYFHTFCYTIIQFTESVFNTSLPRNAGFCWEPGPFSAMINIALYLSLAQHEFKISRIPKRFLIYSLALLTTRSTTGFLMYFIILIYVMYNARLSLFIRNSLLVLFLFFIILVSLNIDFLSDKIFAEIESDFVDAANNSVDNIDGSALPRIVSLRITLLDFMENPLLGFGVNDDIKWLSKNGFINSATITGLGNFLSRFGLILTVLFYYLLYRSSLLFASIYKFKGGLLFFLIMLVFSFSFNIMEAPFYLSLVFFWFFSDSKKVKLI